MGFTILSLIGGGIGGALLTIGYTQFINRLQRIQLLLNITSVFTSSNLKDNYSSLLTFSGSTVANNSTLPNNYHFENLFIITCKFTNAGNQDYDVFETDITLNDDYEIINIETDSPSRSHKSGIIPNINFENTSGKVDLKFTPFNRKDSYEVKFYISSSSKKSITAEDISITTKHPIRYIKTEEQSSMKTFSFTSLILSTTLGVIFVFYFGFQTGKKSETEELLRIDKEMREDFQMFNAKQEELKLQNKENEALLRDYNAIIELKEKKQNELSLRLDTLDIAVGNASRTILFRDSLIRVLMNENASLKKN